MNSKIISQSSRRALLLVLSVSAVIVLLALMMVVPAAIAGTLAPQVGPLIAIPTNLTALPNSTVDVPVNFTANGSSISSIIFSIDYDQTWLTFDPTTPMSITMSLPNGFVGGCTPNLSDPLAEINCFLYDPVPPLEALPDSKLVTIRLKTKDASSATQAAINFSTSNPVSFGNVQGQAETGNTQNGSVCIGPAGSTCGGIVTPPTPGFKSLFLALVWKPLPATVTTTVTVPPGSETPTPTVTPVVTQPPAGCASTTIQNSTFEPYGGYWYLPFTVKTAWFTNYRYHSPNYSVYTGIDPSLQPGINLYSYSSVRTNNNQTFVIPANATKATVKFYMYPLTTELFTLGKDRETLIGEDHKLLPSAPEIGKPFVLAPDAPDIQYFLVLTPDYNNYDAVLASPIWGLSNNRTWLYKEIDLKPWAGLPIKLQWGTYNDGYYGVSALYVDDASLEICTP